jgi:hypothetical protein
MEVGNLPKQSQIRLTLHYALSAKQCTVLLVRNK